MSSYDLVTHFFSILNNTPLSGCACVCFSCFSRVWLFDPVEGSPLDSVRGSPDDDIWCGAYIHMLTYYLHIFFGQHSELSVQFRSVTQSCPTLCDPMDSRMPGLPVYHQLPVYPSSCPLSRWCHPTISSSVLPFSSRLQSFTASGSFQMSQFFASGGQSIGVSASTSILPMNTQDWSPLG